MYVLGLDPGLRRTGWGIIKMESNKLEYVSSGTISSNSGDLISERLGKIDFNLSKIIENHNIQTAAIEEVFVNINPKTSLLLGMARGAAIVACSRKIIPLAEYSSTKIKKSITGNGHATKTQVELMIKMLLPSANTKFNDESDALAVAISHANISKSISSWKVL